MTRAPVARGARLQAQAKINLSLRVLARGVDGYHQLETMFQRITLADTVTVAVTGGSRSLDMSGDTGVPVERNLAWRAALEYERRAGWPAGWRIEITKRIPIGGGLGGGSANAGATLRLLDRLNPNPLGGQALLDMAVGIGADVPFLATSAPLALAWGRGERLMALPALPARPVALLLSPFGVSTAEAFGWLAESRGDGAKSAMQAALLDPERLSSWEGIASVAANDLEAVVFSRHGELAGALELLAERAASGSGLATGEVISRMTGTGSTLFAIPVAGPLAPSLTEGVEWPGGGRVVLTETAARVEEAELIE